YTKIRNWCIRAMTTVRTRPMPTTHDRILDAAERLLARFGYKKTTMEDIAREAGLGKRTLYLHVASKEAVALSTIDRCVDRLPGQLRQVARRLARPRSGCGKCSCVECWCALTASAITRTAWTNCSSRCGRCTWPGGRDTSPPRPKWLPTSWP